MKKTTALLTVLATSGCFDPPDSSGTPINIETDGTTSMSSSGQPQTSSATDATGDPGPSTATSSTGGTSTAGPTTDTDTDAGDTSTGEPQLGPRLVETTPADGDDNAPLETYFLLNFDRPVSQTDAFGHIFVTQGDGDPILVAPQPCPPDADPQCVAGIFPEEFRDPETGDLPGSTPHTIIVSADLPDLDGNTNTLEQVVEFRTFEFTANFFDDSAAISGELGGMVYDPDNEALFIAGTSETGGDCIVRRVDLPGGVATGANTVATPTALGGGPYCYGMQRYGDTLFVDMTYSGDVRVYTGLGSDDLNPTEVVIQDPTLPVPHDDLQEVVATAQAGPRRFFSYGNFVGGPGAFGILELNNDTWSIFQQGTNLWSPGDDVSIAAATIGGTAFLFAVAGEHLYKFRLADASVVDEIEIEQTYDADVEVDEFGRVWVARNGRLHVYDGDDLSVLLERTGLDTGRIGVDAREDGATVYFGRYRDPAVIGRMTVTFP